MTIVSRLLAAAAAAALLAGASEAKDRPVWEIGIGAFGTYSAEYPGSDHYSAGGFPAVYFVYRGKDFSILPNGLYDVAADDTSRFSFGLSLDVNGEVKSKYRLGLDKVKYEGEIGPKLTFGIFSDGYSRLEVSVAARAAFVLDDGYSGFVIQPEIAYLTTLNSSTRLGLSVAPKFGFNKYDDIYYRTPTYNAGHGYIGTDISLKLVNDLDDRFRLSGEVRAISLGGSQEEDSPLFHKKWNYYARVGFTYALYVSDEMTQH